MDEQAPTHNERILAGAIMVVMGLHSVIPPRAGTTIPVPYILREDVNLGMIRIGYQMMGMDPDFIRPGIEYREILEPALDILYDKFGIVEKVMNS